MRVWPFPVNWSDAFSITYIGSTEIIVSRAGNEQRIANRETPRFDYSFSALATFAKRRIVQGLLTSVLNEPFVMAEAPRVRVTAAALADGDTIVPMFEVTSWMTVGRYVVLNDVNRWAFGVIAATGGGSITLEDGVEGPWPASTRVYCGVLGRLINVSVREETNEAWVLSVDFEAAPAVQPDEPDPGAAVTFNGREVFPFTPNWGDLPTSTFTPNVEMVDYDQGPTEAFYPVDFLSRTRNATFLAKSRAEGEAFRQFLYRTRGMQEEFYMATASNDLPLAAGVAGGDNTMTTAGSQVFEDYADSTVYKALCVRLLNGTRIYRQIASITAAGADSLITIVGTWPVAFAPDSVVWISWLPVWRRASDSATIDWRTDSVAEMTLPLVTLEDLPGD